MSFDVNVGSGAAFLLTPKFTLSPELGWNQACDVWSLGCILIEYYLGLTLFQVSGATEISRTLNRLQSILWALFLF